MATLIAVTVFMLWECALVGYTLILASQAADRAAREAATYIPDSDADTRGEDAGYEGLPGAWQDGGSIDVTVEDGEAHAQVDLQVPLAVPGWIDVPITVSSSSAARP